MSSPQWYRDYLASDHWVETRSAALERAKHQCERCGETQRRDIPNLQVHHRTYEHLGAELPEDLEVLCVFCHAVEHGKVDENDPLARDRLHTRQLDRRLRADYVDEIQDEIDAWDDVAEASGF